MESSDSAELAAELEHSALQIEFSDALKANTAGITAATTTTTTSGHLHRSKLSLVAAVSSNIALHKLRQYRRLNAQRIARKWLMVMLRLHRVNAAVSSKRARMQAEYQQRVQSRARTSVLRLFHKIVVAQLKSL